MCGYNPGTYLKIIILNAGKSATAIARLASEQSKEVAREMDPKLGVF